jgi:hypothetical protein
MSEVLEAPPKTAVTLPHSSLYFARDIKVMDSHFWVTFFRPGSLDKLSLSNFPSVSEAIQAVESLGIMGTAEPILVLQQEALEPYQILLVPARTSVEADELESLCSQVRQLIAGLRQKKIGIFIPSGLFDSMRTLLVVGDLIQKTYLNHEVETFHVVLSGHTPHDSLNILWRIQSHMKKIGQSITVYH